MQTKTLYTERIPSAIGQNKTVLEYYIVERSIGEQYCELKSYGVQIKKTDMYEDECTEESRLIGDIFFDKKDAENFTAMLADNMVKPAELRDVIENYIKETIAMRIADKTA